MQLHILLVLATVHGQIDFLENEKFVQDLRFDEKHNQKSRHKVDKSSKQEEAVGEHVSKDVDNNKSETHGKCNWFELSIF